MNEEFLTENDLLVLRDLVRRGFAVAVWTPSELKNLDATDVESVMISAAADFIDLEGE